MLPVPDEIVHSSLFHLISDYVGFESTLNTSEVNLLAIYISINLLLHASDVPVSCLLYNDKYSYA
jgi:hypothetical protein